MVLEVALGGRNAAIPELCLTKHTCLSYGRPRPYYFPGDSMSNPFFDEPILNSQYDYPSRHWELNETGQPTQKIIDSRRTDTFFKPIQAFS